MRILWHPQPSLRRYNAVGARAWDLAADSQINRFIDWVSALPPEWEWTIILPASDRVDRDAELPANVVDLRVPWARNVLAARYDFHINKMAGVVDAARPDVLVCEVPELVRNWRAVQHQLDLDFPIATIAIHLSDGLHDEVDYTCRQADGIIASNLAAFQLDGTLADFSRKLGTTSGEFVQDSYGLGTKVTIWNALFNLDSVPPATTVGLQEKSAPVINFIARLSDNGRTRFREFFRAVELVRARRNDFEVWVANPNGAMTEGEIQELCPGARVQEASRKAYFAGLHSSDIVPILWPQDRIHSRSFCEAIVTRNVIVGDRKSNRCGIHVEVEDPESIAWGIERALDHIGALDHGSILDAQENVVRHRSVQQNIHVVRDDLIALVGR